MYHFCFVLSSVFAKIFYIFSSCSSASIFHSPRFAALLLLKTQKETRRTSSGGLVCVYLL